MDDAKYQSLISADTDETFDQLVCRVSAQLELGREIDLSEIQQLDPQHAARLLELLPTLQAMAGLRANSMASAMKGPGTSDELVNGVLGDFRIQKEVGRGGMGVVYEAIQISLTRRVALKILPFASVLDPRRMQRFQNEARAAASLHHPHIVPVFSVGSERGVHFYAMQFIDGQSLEKVIKEKRQHRRGQSAVAFKADSLSLPTTRVTPPNASRSNANEPSPEISPGRKSSNQSPAEQGTVPIAKGSTERSKPDSRWSFSVAETVSNVADALHHAHQAGVIHRDIKPANLMFDATGKIWVTDFGLAHIETNDTLTVSGDLLGTLRYMSPEQAGGQAYRVDYRSDIYSLGVTLYELLTLEPAFPGRDRKQLLHDILDCEPSPIRKLDNTLPVELEIIVGKAMAKEPLERYQSAADFAADLRRFLKNEPIRARQPSRWQHAKKWCQRHVAMVTVLAGTAVILSLAAAVTSILLWNQSVQLSAALQDARKAKLDAETSQGEAELARDNEVQARQHADDRAAEAKTILNFLEQHILAVARPEGIDGGLGRDLTLRQAIDQAIPFVEQEFQTQPRIELGLRRVFGISYVHLAEYEAARLQFLRGHELSEQHLGATHIDTLGLLVNLGIVEQNLGDLVAAEDRLSEAWDHLHRKYPQHEFTENCLTNQASLDLDLGKHMAAAEKFELVLAARRGRLGAEHPSTLLSLAYLAMAYKELGRLREAESILQQVVVAQTARFGLGRPETWSALTSLAEVEDRLGNLESATKIRRQLLKEKQAVLGDDHISTLGAQVNWAQDLENQGQITEAETILKTAVPTLQEKYAKHEFTLIGMNALAGILESRDTLEEAIELYQETLKISEDLRGPEHVFTLGVRVNLASCWLQSGQAQRVIVTLRQVLRKLKANYPDHDFTDIAVHTLSQAHMDLGQFAAAVTPLKELLERRQTKLPDDSPQLLKAKLRLALCYRNVGNVNAAEPLLEAVLPILRRDYRGHELLALAAGNLGIINLDGHNPAVAGELFAEAYQARNEELGPGHHKTLGELVNWGLAEWQSGEPEAAATRMEEALVAFRSGSVSHPHYGTCLAHLISIYEELRYSDQEAQLLKEFEQWLVGQGGHDDPLAVRVRVRQAQRSGDWEGAHKLVQDFEAQLSADFSGDYCIAAGLRARLAEMVAELQPTEVARLNAQQKRVKYWLQRAEMQGAQVAVECQHDPAMRRYFSQHQNHLPPADGPAKTTLND